MEGWIPWVKNEMLVAKEGPTSEKLFTTENCMRWTDRGVEKVCVYLS